MSHVCGLFWDLLQSTKFSTTKDFPTYVLSFSDEPQKFPPLNDLMYMVVARPCMCISAVKMFKIKTIEETLFVS